MMFEQSKWCGPATAQLADVFIDRPGLLWCDELDRLVNKRRKRRGDTTWPHQLQI
jgi:hypothetical protein